MADSVVRDLVLRRAADGVLALHDAASGLILAAQTKVTVVQEPGDLTRLIVEFTADARVGQSVMIEVSDG